METQYTISNKLKYKLMHKCAWNYKGYRVLYTLGSLLQMLSGFIAVAICILIWLNSRNEHNYLTISTIGLAVWLSIFYFGNWLSYHCLLRYGRPYSLTSKEFMYSDDSGICYGFHNLSSSIDTEMTVYATKYSDIKEVKFDAKLNKLSIIGSTNETIYNNFAQNKIDRTSNISEYSLLLCIEEVDEFLRLLHWRRVLIIHV